VQALLSGADLTHRDVTYMVNSGRVPAGTHSSELEGGRIQDIARARLYGQAQVRLKGIQLSVSTTFVTALAGSILAAELQRHLGRRPDSSWTGA
jgi:hypothetical protein